MPVATSLPERIAQRLQTLLTGATPAGAKVWRDREAAITREDSPAVLIEISDEDPETMGGAGHVARMGMDRSVITVLVTVCVRGDEWQTTADAVRVAAHARIAADAELRGMAVQIRRGRCEWRPANTDLPFGFASQAYLFTVLGSTTDLTVSAR